jgi:hypothetical protein
MKNKQLVFTVILMFLTATAYSQASPRTAPNNAFSYGEKLIYKVKYSLYVNVPVGEFSLEVQPKAQDMNGSQCYHIIGKGKTYGFYDPFFKIRDNYETFLETNSVLPLYSSRDVNEGHYSFNETVIFNQKDRTAKSKKRSQRIPDSTGDIIGSLYFARTLDFHNAKPGQEYLMNAFIDDTTYHVGVKFDGIENIRTAAGHFRCVRLKPLLIQGRIFKSKEDMTLWVTDDENHLPVQVESSISVGSVKVELHSFENLHNQITAKL